MKINMEEILTGLMFVVLGYFIAMMFAMMFGMMFGMCSCNSGFRVGGQGRHSGSVDPQIQADAALHQQQLQHAGCLLENLTFTECYNKYNKGS